MIQRFASIRRVIPALAALALVSCSGTQDQDGPVKVSVIGPQPALAPVGRSEAPAPQAALLLAVAQGLVSLDASGRIEPGLAQRWIVSDDGLSYIFRLRRADWRTGKPVTASELARTLRNALDAGGRNRLAPYFAAVDEVVAVTPEILEIRLSRPRPHFLDLLTQPELALLAGKTGAGPFRLTKAEHGTITLEPVADPDFPDERQANYSVLLHAERAARALVRYQRGDSDLVTGGSFADLPVARAADFPAAQLRFDPARGLFGLAILRSDGFLATPENRAAVAMAIDRDAIVQAFAAPGWQPVTAIVPERLEMPVDPAQPAWAALGRAERVEAARLRVTAWRGSKADPPRLTIALPDGPGARLLFALLSADLARIGIVAERVAQNASADLRLIDAVAPNDSATWWLTRLACETGLPCSDAAREALAASRIAPTLAERAAKLAEADAAYAANVPFIPIATPLRWSLVRSSLRGFQPNNRAAHPLHRLLND